jgi:hypothetical protein
VHSSANPAEVQQILQHAAQERASNTQVQATEADVQEALAVQHRQATQGMSFQEVAENAMMEGVRHDILINSERNPPSGADASKAKKPPLPARQKPADSESLKNRVQYNPDTDRHEIRPPNPSVPMVPIKRSSSMPTESSDGTWKRGMRPPGGVLTRQQHGSLKKPPALQALDDKGKTAKAVKNQKESARKKARKAARAPTPAPISSEPAPSPAPVATEPTPGVPNAASLDHLSTPRNAEQKVDEDGFTEVSYFKPRRNYAQALTGSFRDFAAQACASMSPSGYDNATNVQTSSSEDTVETRHTSDSNQTHNRFSDLDFASDDEADEAPMDPSPPADEPTDEVTDALVEVSLEDDTVEPTSDAVEQETHDGTGSPDDGQTHDVGNTSSVKDQAE